MPPPSFLRRLATLVLLVLHCSGIAAPLAPLSSDYTHVAWGTLQGAPAKILAIAQTADGWLWLASEAGLYRYDGVQFERVQQVYGQPLASSGIYRVAAGRDGALWVSYYLGGMSVFRKDGARTFGEQDGVPPGLVFDIQTAPDASVWIATRAGTLRLAAGGRRFERQEGNVGLDGGLATRILFARDGTQWILGASGAFFRHAGASRFTLAARNTFTNIAEAPDGGVWVLTNGDRYWRLRAVPASAQPASRPELGAIALGFDRDGFAWVLNRHDVERRRAATDAPSEDQRLTRGSGLSGNFPQSFLQDREGNIWIATAEGLDRFRRNRLRPMTINEEFLFPGVFRRPDGTIWISNSVEGIHRIDHAGNSERISQERFTAGHQAPDGTFWLAGYQGARREAPDGTVTTIAPPDGTFGKEANAVAQDREGALWLSVSGGGGLFRLTKDGWLKQGGVGGFPRSPVFSMARDSNGTLWMGHARNAISLVDVVHGRPVVRCLDGAAGLRLGNVLALLPDGQAMWAAGEQGVMLFRAGRFAALRGTQGESFRGIAGIVRLTDGDLWLHGIDGLYHVRAASLAAWMRAPARPVPFERFDAQDGLRGQAPQLRPLPSLLADLDGKLWAATGSAVVALDPRHIYRNPLTPPVVLRTVASNDASYDVEGHAALTLPEGTDSLRFTFTALSLSIPERVRFRFRLVGVDRGWSVPLERRAASYTNLAPGKYRFEVSATNEDGIWNPDPVGLDVEILPTFVQTRWFTLLLVLGGALLLNAAYRWRVRAISARLHERHRVQLEERVRIARSLHDTLLQSVQGVMLSFSAHAKHVPAQSREREELDETLGFARALISEARDRIMGLRVPASGELCLALQTYGEELARHGNHAFEARSTGQARVLRPDVHEEMYVVGREAIVNATRHAKASRVLLEIDYGRDAFTLIVRDDGRGVPPSVLDAGERPGHWGLRSMRERALGMRASYRLSSDPGKGTEITVALAASMAYQEAPTSSAPFAASWLRRAVARMRRT